MNDHPYVRVLTNSEVGTFACELKWSFSYLDGLTHGDSAAPLRQGSLGHRCLATYYRSVQLAQTIEVEPLTAGEVGALIIDPWLDQRRAFAEENWDRFDFDLEEKLAEDRELAELTLGIMQGYTRAWWDDISRYRILDVEGQAARWIIDPRTGKRMFDMPTIKGKRRRRYWARAGAMDLLVEDMVDGGIWLAEHKHTSETDLEHYCRKLDWDPQIRGYGWILRDPIPHLSTIKAPTPVRGVLYNVIRKKLPRTPDQLAKCKHCKHPKSAHSATGCEGSQKCECSLAKYESIGTSKAACDTTRELFTAELLARGENPDHFRDRLEKLPGWEAFFYRREYPITGPELDRYEADQSWMALRIREASKPGTVHPRQQTVCTGIGALPCQYRSICTMDGNMARAGFNVKTIRHEELWGDLAEPHAGVERGLELGYMPQPKLIDHEQLVQLKTTGEAPQNDVGAFVDPFAEETDANLDPDPFDI